MDNTKTSAPKAASSVCCLPDCDGTADRVHCVCCTRRQRDRRQEAPPSMDARVNLRGGRYRLPRREWVDER